jgi:hypothetical protein
MYRPRTQGSKRNPVKRWNLPDRVFFACGACHILAYAFLRTYPQSGFRPIWIRPAPGFTGNHIVVARGDLAFDYHGYSSWSALQTHMEKRAHQFWPGWRADLVPIPEDVLISEPKSRTVGLWLMEPGQFLFDALPRAERFLKRFQPAPTRDGAEAMIARRRAALQNAG